VTRNRLRTQRIQTGNRAFRRTDQQWLFRGRNSLGLNPQPRDVIQAMVEHTVAHGVRRLRVFDGMNDAGNIRSTVEAVNG
jgi:oxaloacetate decarboxylase alpha subunit